MTTARRQLVKSFIESNVNKHQVVIFGKSWCPYCIRSKALFASDKAFEDVDVQTYDLDVMGAGSMIQEELYRMTGQGTVPSIWINGTFMGGNTEIHKVWRAGQLSTMLQNGVEDQQTRQQAVV